MATLPQSRTGFSYASREHRSTSPPPHFNYETYYKHQEKQPTHTNALLQYLSETELRYRNDNLYENEAFRLPRRTDILNRYITMNPNFEHLNRVYEPNLTNIEKQRYRRCVEQQQQKLHRIKKKFDFQTADGHNSHYFLTGARYNRFDTVDSKILMKYGTFINRNNPEQVDIKASHFKKFREILQAQQRSSSTGGAGGDSARRDLDYGLASERKHEEDLEDLTNRYERSSSRQSNLKTSGYGTRTKLPKIKDAARYVDAGSQMPERKRGRRSLDRAVSSSSTHRSNRHRRHSQHQQQPSPAPQSSVSYVANKVSFSLVNEPNAPLLSTTNKQNEDDYELIATEEDDRHQHHLQAQSHHHHHHHQQQQQQQQHHHIIPGESIDDDDADDDDAENVRDEEVQNNDQYETKRDEDNRIVVEQIRQQANAMVSDILTAAIHQISIVHEEEID